MKKALITLAVVAAGFSSFAQGEFLFQAAASSVWSWTNNSSQVPVFTRYAAGSLDVAFLIATTNSAAALSSIATSTHTNGTTLTSSQLTTAWNDILTPTDGYLLASGTNGASVAVALSGNLGQWTYNSSTSYQVSGEPAGGYEVYVIAWSGGYATPALAAAAGADLGWSAPFGYNSPAFGGSPAPQLSAGQGFSPFGLAVVATPEPSTIALAGLGVSALVAFRRRNSSK